MWKGQQNKPFLPRLALWSGCSIESLEILRPALNSVTFFSFKFENGKCTQLFNINKNIQNIVESTCQVIHGANARTHIIEAMVSMLEPLF